jgi:preprotein translocase subunit SecE
MFSKIKKLFKEVQYELSKVTWSSRKQLMSSTLVVIIVSVILAFFIGAVDFGLTKLAHLLFR